MPNALLGSKVEYKVLPMSNFSVNLEKRTVFGYASTFADRDSYDDRMMPGAFLKTVNEKFTEPTQNGMGPRIKVFVNHDMYSLPIGVLEKIYEDEKGLFVQYRVLNTPRGDEALRAVHEKAIDQHSIGFITKEFKETEEGRDIYEVELLEVSLVNFPANSNALVVGVKQQFSLTELVEIKDALSSLAAQVSALQATVEAKSGVEEHRMDKEQMKKLRSAATAFLSAMQECGMMEDGEDECGGDAEESGCDKKPETHDGSCPGQGDNYDPVDMVNPANCKKEEEVSAEVEALAAVFIDAEQRISQLLANELSILALRGDDCTPQGLLS